jgi:catechol 2,3-dioxygenase-like lactoylglutathione lyase family enzyme
MLGDCRAYAMIPVHDLPRARSFYQDTLGLKVREERDGDVLFECADGTAFGVFASQGRTSGTHTQLAFMCDDIEAEVADLRGRGVEPEDVDMPGVAMRDGVYELDGERGVWFRDPEGNLLALAQQG